VIRVGAFGGPYANPFALRACLEDARARGGDELLCLGDLGGFGAECDAIRPLLDGVRCIAATTTSPSAAATSGLGRSGVDRR